MTTRKLPPGACDCHVHVFLPDRYPYAEDRVYTPGRVTGAQLARFLDGHGLARVVLVQPSVYGTDNRAMLDAMAELGRKRARGVAVIDLSTTTDEALADLDAAGVVGIRLNVTTRERGDVAKAVTAANKRLAGTRWHIQIYAPIGVVADAERTLARLGRPVVLDHFGGARIGAPRMAEGLRAVSRLVRNGPAWVKLSAAYRVSDRAGEVWPDVEPLAVSLIDMAPERMLWGSDWPHTGGHDRRATDKSAVEPFQAIDDRVALGALATWAGSTAMLRRILVANPARLYGFG